MSCGQSKLLAKLLTVAVAALSVSVAPAFGAGEPWRAEIITTPGPVQAVKTAGGEIRVLAGARWYRPVTA